jgi:ABC-type antimicrobial peptide transport system permease subunit
MTSRFRYLVLRTSADPALVLPAVRQVVRDLDPDLPLSSVATVDDLVAAELYQPRSLSLLVGGFAAVALILSIVGIYGVMAYYVQQQLKEIGIRLALGATPRDVLGLILRQGMTVVAVGVVIGLIAARLASRGMSTLLFGVTTHDLLPPAIVALLMGGVALTACLLPARRATRLQPTTVLRTE